MALKATIFKADISITDMDRNYYNDHNLTIARHPSENDERMMLRVVALLLMLMNAYSLPKDCLTMTFQIYGKRVLAMK